MCGVVPSSRRKLENTSSLMGKGAQVQTKTKHAADAPTGVDQSLQLGEQNSNTP